MRGSRRDPRVAAHGDIPATKAKAIQKEYNADRIMAALERLLPEFFPVALSRSGVDDLGTHRNWRVDDAAPGYLTKSEFLELYGRAGDVLHRGSLRNYTAEKRPSFPTAGDLTVWLDKLEALLSIHAIVMIGGDNLILCDLAGGPDGRGWVVYAGHKEDGR